MFLVYKNTSINKCTRSLLLRDQTNKHAEVSCFLNHNSSIHFCCTDCLLMTHCGGLSLSIIIWRIGGGGPSFLLPWGPKILLAALVIGSPSAIHIVNILLKSKQILLNHPITLVSQVRFLPPHLQFLLQTFFQFR